MLSTLCVVPVGTVDLAFRAALLCCCRDSVHRDGGDMVYGWSPIIAVLSEYLWGCAANGNCDCQTCSPIAHDGYAGH
jgi:hypothetical protein